MQRRGNGWSQGRWVIIFTDLEQKRSGVSRTRIFRGFGVPEFWRGDYGLAFSPSSQTSLLLCVCSFLYLEFSFLWQPHVWLPYPHQDWPSLVVLFKITAPSTLFLSHNLLFSISLITTRYNIFYLFIISPHWNVNTARVGIFVLFWLLCISNLTHNQCSISMYSMNEWMNKMSTYYVLTLYKSSHTLNHLILTKILWTKYCY